MEYLDEPATCYEEDLKSKNLTEVPEYVLKNSQLVSLFIDYNNLKELPSVFGSVLPNLTFLSVIGNSLSSLPESFGQLSKIEEVYFNENELVKIPDTFCGLKNLKKLNLTGNKLSLLPVEFGELSSLEVLYSDENGLERLPKTFGLLSRLKELELGCNEIQSLSEGFGMLSSLKVLNLSNNKLESLPESFGNLPSLQALDLSSNEIKFLPSNFKSAPCIEKIYFESNLLQFLPKWVSDMRNIVEFSVKDNQFQHQTLPDAFPPSCGQLKHLDMSGNFMTCLPSTLGDLGALEFLHLGSVIGELERRNFQNGNWLSSLPDSMCCLKHLKELHVDENQISELPENFGDLVCLETLDLGQNLLHVLPDSFGQLRSLRVCMLSKNHLQWLPSNFGDLGSLEDLRLDSNELAELPVSFCQLTSLKSLDLFSNRLHEIPTALHSLTNLVRLDLEDNDFPIPLSEVPQINRQSRYPPRDPNLKDNWRGRPRQDITNLDVIKQEETSMLDFEPPPPSLNYSEDFLIRAMQQNFSIWRDHSEGQGRRRGRKWRLRPLAPGSEEEVEEEETSSEEEDSDDNYEPPVLVQVTPWSGLDQSTLSVQPGDETHINIQQLLEETECWDEEIDTSEIETYDNVPTNYIHPTKMYYPPVDNGPFTFAPFDIHEQDFVKRPERYGVEDEQFDNCDDDDTQEVAVDPIF